MNDCVCPQAVQWFWRVVHGLQPEQQKQLLFFVTGSDRVPIKGLASLTPPFTISRAGPHSDRLPTAHTCFNHLLLPDYQVRHHAELNCCCSLLLCCCSVAATLQVTHALLVHPILLLQDPMCGFGTKAVCANSVVVVPWRGTVQMHWLHVSIGDHHLALSTASFCSHLH